MQIVQKFLLNQKHDANLTQLCYGVVYFQKWKIKSPPYIKVIAKAAIREEWLL